MLQWVINLRISWLMLQRADQKQRLNLILLRLLARLPGKQPLDLSFLLEPGRRQRKKPSMLNP
jgi:histone-lysine N-methyltransferase ASH1L